MDRNREHLNILAIFHYVLGGLTALGACVPIIHFVIGLIITVAPQNFDQGQGPPAFLGWLFMALSGCFIVCGWILALLLILAGRNLQRPRHYLFCLVVAGLSCLLVPLGTVLGVFTIVVLARPGVKELFEETGAGAPPTPAAA